MSKNLHMKTLTISHFIFCPPSKVSPKQPNMRGFIYAIIAIAAGYLLITLGSCASIPLGADCRGSVSYTLPDSTKGKADTLRLCVDCANVKARTVKSWEKITRK